MMIKNVILFCLKKHQLDFSKVFLIVKGFNKKLLKIIYMFKSVFFHTSLYYIQPLKTYKFFNLKKKRSIKRRIFKKLVSFSNS